MALPYFYEQKISASASLFLLSEETSRHCIQVLRMKKGDQLHITNGAGYLFTASVKTEDKRCCSVTIESTAFKTPVSKKISIGISLLKNTGRFEWFLEKATEIGVNEIIPLLCQRTEKQHFRQDRMNNILIAAMLQSQQTWLPQLHIPARFEVVIDQSGFHQKLIAHCEDNEKNVLKDMESGASVRILIGPEGDFSSEEILSALKNGFNPVSLGNTRLRTETAGVVAASLLRNL